MNELRLDWIDYALEDIRRFGDAPEFYLLPWEWRYLEYTGVVVERGGHYYAAPAYLQAKAA